MQRNQAQHVDAIGRCGSYDLRSEISRLTRSRDMRTLNILTGIF